MKEEKVTIVAKGYLVFDETTKKGDINKLEITSEKYMEACNYLAESLFYMGLSRLSLGASNSFFYHIGTDDFGLKSQMSQSCSKTVIGSYSTIKEQLKQNPWHYYNKETKETFTFSRDLAWLTNTIVYKNPFYDAVWNRDYTLKDNYEDISINVLPKGSHRIECKVMFPDYFKKYFNEEWKLGTAKIFRRGNRWCFHVPLTKVFSVPECQDIQEINGLDRGIRFTVVKFDGKNTDFSSGTELEKKRDNYARLRAELQSRGTKSAKKLLKKISGRESRWMDDVNHCLSKTLASECEEGTLLVLENLTGVSFDVKGSADSNRQKRSWSFFDLEKKLTYKAHMNKCEVIKVSAQYTSQRCPKCGEIRKENRDHESHQYICSSCGYKSNDDRVGAMNIYELGQRWVGGENKPKFSKPKEKKALNFTEPKQAVGITDATAPIDDILNILV